MEGTNTDEEMNKKLHTYDPVSGQWVEVDAIVKQD
jgi:hypothetical protein